VRKKCTSLSTDPEYQIGFSEGYSFLTAYELFGDKPLIKSKGKVYFRDDIAHNFYTKNFERLSLSSGDRVSTSVEDSEKMTPLSDIIKDKNRDDFSKYFSDSKLT